MRPVALLVFALQLINISCGSVGNDSNLVVTFATRTSGDKLKEFVCYFEDYTSEILTVYNCLGCSIEVDNRILRAELYVSESVTSAGKEKIKSYRANFYEAVSGNAIGSTNSRLDPGKELNVSVFWENTRVRLQTADATFLSYLKSYSTKNQITELPTKLEKHF